MPGLAPAHAAHGPPWEQALTSAAPCSAICFHGVYTHGLWGPQSIVDLVLSTCNETKGALVNRARPLQQPTGPSLGLSHGEDSTGMVRDGSTLFTRGRNPASECTPTQPRLTASRRETLRTCLLSQTSKLPNVTLPSLLEFHLN